MSFSLFSTRLVNGTGDKRADFSAKQLEDLCFDGRYINCIKVYKQGRFKGAIVLTRKYTKDFDHIDNFKFYTFADKCFSLEKQAESLLPLIIYVKGWS